MRRLVAVLSIVSACAVLVQAREQRATFDVPALLDRYLRGDHDAAVASAAAIPDLGPFRLRFVQDSPAWVHADPARIEARNAAAAAYLLELTAARLESDWGRFTDLIEWTCVQLRTAGPPTEFERSWHAASHALAGRARSRVWLLGESARLPHQKPIVVPARKNQPPPVRHLMHALERFPDDPQFQLNRIMAWTWGRDALPIRNVRLRDQDDEIDRRQPRRPPPQVEAVVALQPLMAVPAVAAEAWIRAGFVQITASDHAAALAAFEKAQPIATEPSMKYLSHFGAARALEGLAKPDEAMRQYRLALEIVPDAESATVALTSLQFTRDERDAVIAQIDRVFNRTPAETDPGRLISYGSFIHWPAIKAALRTAVSAYSK
jgi:tetratricopeptide (TPR) repeat protein